MNCSRSQWWNLRFSGCTLTRWSPPRGTRISWRLLARWRSWEIDDELLHNKQWRRPIQLFLPLEWSSTQDESGQISVTVCGRPSNKRNRESQEVESRGESEITWDLFRHSFAFHKFLFDVLLHLAKTGGLCKFLTGLFVFFKMQYLNNGGGHLITYRQDRIDATNKSSSDGFIIEAESFRVVGITVILEIPKSRNLK